MYARRMAVLALLIASNAHALPWKRSATKNLQAVANATREVSFHRTESPITRLADERFQAAKAADSSDHLAKLVNNGSHSIDRKSLTQGVMLRKVKQKATVTSRNGQLESIGNGGRTRSVGRLGIGLGRGFSMRTLDQPTDDRPEE
jgi:hypothetical protein